MLGTPEISIDFKNLPEFNLEVYVYVFLTAQQHTTAIIVPGYTIIEINYFA